MNRVKPVIAFISLNSSHLKIDRQTYKGPLRSLYRVRTEIPTLSVTFFKQYHHSQWKTRGTKKKSLSTQINFFTVQKRQTWWKSGGRSSVSKATPNFLKSINSKHQKSWEDVDYENEAVIWGLIRKKNQRTITATC